ncbi:hypothetical protein, variant [Verruconis gallopava]|uniref:Uncharacterized protein n=1 Tax=Verruconis gallopava TaxID=253628 RepID=A0A0D2A1H3_9PEZI|nr:uncharacterized protein PV09_08027 [Verruconis gallopava]XP_016210377.1 hypothetical protein, variant [Verruconis gallopava]KIW00507.1 hypothetical protein PV09_08027 [Verruconis gallopava]KIW00508.1 hypothetical protein, variant [Verruconis gallopava]
MSKLSAALKSLINAPAARPGPLTAPRNIASVFERIEREAEQHGLSQPEWLALTTAATMTMNSPNSLAVLYQHATRLKKQEECVKTAELMREIGLKCIGFNGIPRTINMLGAFRASLPAAVRQNLSTGASRVVTPENVKTTQARGLALWNSIYRPHETKLLEKLADSHPDLPVYILQSYSVLFADPSPKDVRVGRVLTSLVAIACLRAQTGVGPQVTSHIFGLRKAFEDGTWKDDMPLPESGVAWLSSDEGSMWALNVVDYIVEAISRGEGSSFAQMSRL